MGVCEGMVRLRSGGWRGRRMKGGRRVAGTMDEMKRIKEAREGREKETEGKREGG